jgi:hypothetical protein
MSHVVSLLFCFLGALVVERLRRQPHILKVANPILGQRAEFGKTLIPLSAECGDKTIQHWPRPFARDGLHLGLPRFGGRDTTGSDGKCLFRVSAGTSGQAVPATVFVVVPGDLPPSGGSYGLAPPLAHAAGAVRVRRQVFVSRFSWKSGQAVPATVFVVPGDLPPSGGSYGLAPRLHTARGEAPVSDGKCSSRVSAGRSGQAVPATVFVVPGDLPPSGGLVRPRPPACICSRGAVRVRRQVFVSAFQLEGAGQAVPGTGFLSYPGDLPPSGARTASPPACIRSRGGQSGLRRVSGRPAFQLEGAGRGRASNGFCLSRGPSAKRGGSVRPRSPHTQIAGGSPGQTASRLSRVSAGRSGSRPWQQRFLSYPGTFRQAGGVGPRPPLAYARGGAVRVRRRSVRPAFQLERAGRPCQQRFLSYPGTFRQAGARYGLASPLARARGGTVRVRRQVFVLRFS